MGVTLKKSRSDHSFVHDAITQLYGVLHAASDYVDDARLTTDSDWGSVVGSSVGCSVG